MKKLTTEQLNIMVQEVNSWNSALEHLEFHEMEMLDGMVGHEDIAKVIAMVQYGDFRITDDYFGFDGYGNLKSLTEIEYNDLLNEYHDEIVDTFEYEVELNNIEDSYNFLSEIVDIPEMAKNFKEIEDRLEKSGLVTSDYKETLYAIIGGSREVFEALYDGEIDIAVVNMDDYGIDIDSLKDTEKHLNEAVGV